MSEKPAAIFLKDYQVPDFLINQVTLRIDLHEDHATVLSSLSFVRNSKASTHVQDVRLQGEDLTLEEIQLNEQPLDSSQYAVDDAGLTLFAVPNEFILTTRVRIVPQQNKSFMGLYQSRGNFCTQCEAQGFRRITYFLDRPDIMTRFSVTVSADKARCPYLLSNGNWVDQGELTESGRHWVRWEDPSLKPCYLFALVAGDFDLIEDTYTTVSGREVALKFYLEKGFGEQGHFALDSLKRAMQWDEQTYGLEYDLDIYMVVAVSDFNMGAMENKGLNVFNTKYVLAQPQTATDADYYGIEKVIGHEYFHNWTGNRVTCRDWFQLTLKEGLTVFRDQTFTEDMNSAVVARIGDINMVRNQQFAEDAGPLAHPIRPPSYIEINNFYTSTVYRKGAEVIRMIHTLIGASQFRAGMDLYFQRHDGQAVTTEDFVSAMADASGRDLSQFKRWYSQAGTPVLTVSDEYDDQQKTLRLRIEQTCPQTPDGLEKAPFHMPFAVGLVGRQGEALPLHLESEVAIRDETAILELKSASQEFVFSGVEQRPTVSLNRGFSAPVKVKYKSSLESLAHLAIHDADPVARWDAAQQLGVEVLLAAADKIAGQQRPVVNSVLVECFDAILHQDNQDKSVLPFLVGLPSVNYVFSQAQDRDILSLYHARQFYLKELAEAFQADWLFAYRDDHDKGEYVYSQQAIAKRAWKNTCLHYLVFSDPYEYADLAYKQLKRSNNMTDSMGALASLNNVETPRRQMALDEFYDQWKDEPLVINKWLTLQATSTLEGTLDQVKQLESHPAFSLQNPNNVYALIGGFGVNLPVLHACKSGQGYAFLAEKVITINGYNPQVAARVIQPLTRWREYDENRAALMKGQLERIAKEPNLSTDIYEVVEKCLV